MHSKGRKYGYYKLDTLIPRTVLFLWGSVGVVFGGVSGVVLR